MPQKTTFLSFSSQLRPLLLAVVLLYLPSVVLAQAPKADTADKIKVILAQAGKMEFFKTDSGSYIKYVTDVIIYQGTDTLYCDSLYNFTEKKKLEAFGNVRIAQQGGTEATCDYLRYQSELKLAYMTGNVGLTDGKNNLWCEELDYNLSTKVGTYNRNGTLQSDSTIVSSERGTYDVRSHEARFIGNVTVADPRYKITSKDLGYNTETKVETFFAHSVVTSDSGRSVLTTSRGTYDSKNVVAHFTGRSSIWNEGQYIEADSMQYDKLSGYGYAIGQVVSIDTEQHATIYCGRADFFRRKRVLWAIIKPVVEIATGKDTFYMRADTFYSAPMVKVPGRAFKMPVDLPEVSTTDSARVADSTIAPKTSTAKPAEGSKGKRGRNKKVVADSATLEIVAKPAVPDSMWIVPDIKYRLADFYRDTGRKALPATIANTPSKKKKKHRITPAVDTTDGDTTAPVFFTGYHHVLIFSDSLQARCDSVTFTRCDSVVRMINEPVAWSRGSQITGDTIYMQLDSSSVRSMYVPDNSFIVSRSGPEQADLFDQVQGKTLTAFFKDNNIRKMIVQPDAQSIYFTKDDNGAYMGLSQANAEVMRIFFGEEKISRIKYIKNVQNVMTPMEQADLPNARLSRFKWLYNERPQSKEELFR
ncbi:MAG: hypothetical protein IAE95_09840 [Chitinophagaceae bacterium]|nr:hypothetical protein [Chitinophagaceae bacterium]